MIKLISAVSVDGAIGHDNDLLWHIPEDLQRYKEKTTNNIVIVGLNTFFSLPKAALKNRTHIVVCGDCMDIKKIEGEDVIAVNFISEAISVGEELSGDRMIYVAGGSMIYDTMIDLCDFLEITWVNKEFPEANKRFPIDKLNHFSKYADDDWLKSGNLEYKFSYYNKK